MTNMSHPIGDSINTNIDEKDATVKYTSFDDTLKLVVQQGKGAWMAKLDLDSAFWQIPIDWESLQYFGFMVDEDFFIHVTLPFGSFSSCSIFQMVANFLAWAAQDRTGRPQRHYLDDFFFCNLNKAHCCEDLRQFQELCNHLGFPVSTEKTEGPAQYISFLGIGIDTINWRITIPQNK